MKIRIYQIDMDADKDNLAFRNLEFVYKKASGRVPEEIYTQVYEGEIENSRLDYIFYIFNQMIPEQFKSRSMSVSDVVEVVHSKESSSFYFVDSVGFRHIPFDRTKTKEAEQ